MKTNLRNITTASVIAGVYVLLTVLPPFNTISSGMVQVRLAEALMILCICSPSAVFGVILGCFISNFSNPFEIIFGTFATILPAIILFKYKSFFSKNIFFAPIPVILSNALIVSIYLPYIISPNQPLSWAVYGTYALSIAIGEAIATYGIGIILYKEIGRIL